MYVYADNAATTKMSRAAQMTMIDAMERVWGNPSSLHTTGQEAKEALEGARDLRNMIRKNIEDVIVNTMIENSERFLTEVAVCVEENKIKIDYKF